MRELSFKIFPRLCYKDYLLYEVLKETEKQCLTLSVHFHSNLEENH